MLTWAARRDSPRNRAKVSRWPRPGVPPMRGAQPSIREASQEPNMRARNRRIRVTPRAARNMTLPASSSRNTSTEPREVDGTPPSTSLQIRVPPAHRFGGLAGAVAELEDDQLEEDGLGKFEERAHRQDGKPRSLIVGHGLGRDDDAEADLAGGRAIGLGRDDHGPCSGGARDFDQRLGGREMPQSGRHDEEVAGPQ